MPTPNVYYALNERHEYLRALVFQYLMSDECPSIDSPKAAALFEEVGDMTTAEAGDAVRAWQEAN